MARYDPTLKIVTVELGDTLSQIAVDYAGGYSKYKKLATINSIENPDLIYVGQTIYLNSANVPESASSTSASSNTVTNLHFGLQSNTDRTLFVTWTWTKESDTKEYKVVWYYAADDGVSFVGNNSTNTVDEDLLSASRQSTYDIPDKATKVWVKIKPISKEKDKKGGTYFTANWATSSKYLVSSLPLDKPSSAPTVEIKGLTLTASLDNIDIDGATHVEFQVIRDNSASSYASKKVAIVSAHASHQFSIAAGSEYKVWYRVYRTSDSSYSGWSPFSDNYKTMPAAPSGITLIRANSKTSVYLEWGASPTATRYEIQYTTESRYFDSSSEVTTVTGDGDTKITKNHWEVTGLTTGDEYYFRVRAVDEDSNDQSAWTDFASVAVGSIPSAPTTWSSTTTAIVGESLNLYWVHNAKDGSLQTYAELEVYIDGSTTATPYTFDDKKTIDDALLTYTPLTEEEKEEGKTNSCAIKTASYKEGTKIEWRVRTAGVTKEYGEWSTQRTIDIYAPPTLELKVTDKDENEINTLNAFPLYISGLPGPETQAPIGYHVSITSNEIYETVDNVGNPKVVNAGEAVYSKYFDTTNDSLLVELSASNLDLENSISYTITCTVSMNSGLTAEQTAEITVDWVAAHYSPNAEITIDSESMTATIRPYCENRKRVYYQVESGSGYVRTDTEFDYVYGTIVKDAKTTDGYKVYSGTAPDGSDIYYCIVDEAETVVGVTMAVYRREFDGSFTEIATDLDSESHTSVTDPHPALDYARYRIVAIDNETGAVSYYDLPGHPVGGIAAIIQWNDSWSNFETNIDDELAQPAWSGSMLKLPYNIDVSDSNSRDVSLVEYVGQESPTSYYGTHRGQQSTWSVEIDKSDKETLYALRRLQRWMGDVYVREPSGSGYWASVSVSFSQKHCELTIPVTLNINKVEGGA